ncbi:MAG TPA: hypothetical protein VMY87_02365 [Armatimonadota bacterium]|nr:hypothetical protein [Armatimonadota bacterium]
MKKRHLLVMREGEKGQTIPESPIPQETALQEAFKEHPELIPVSDLGMGRLLIVGREASIGSGGAIDLLAVDPSGRVVIAEFKRGPENPDSRRVIAQLLEYSSWLWTMPYEDFDEGVAQRYFNEGECSEAAVTGAANLEEAAEAFWRDVEGFSVDDFRQGLTNALSEGELDCVVISSELDRNIRRVIDLLNATSSLRFYGIEVDHFAEAGRRVFVPRATAGPVKEPPRPKSPRTTKANFLTACSEQASAFFSRILGYMESTGETVYWGTRGFSFRITVGGQKRTVFYGYPRGTVGHASDYGQIVVSELGKAGISEESLTQYSAAVAELAVISNTDLGNVTFDVDEKADAAAADVLIAALRRLLADVRGT